MSEKNTGLKRVAKATYYSYRGIVAAFQHEAAFRQELFLALVLIPLALWLPVSLVECILLILVLGLVLIAELVNSAIEAVVDRVGLERNELAGRAKDLGSAAVFVALLLCCFVWGAILWSLYFLS